VPAPETAVPIARGVGASREMSPLREALRSERRRRESFNSLTPIKAPGAGGDRVNGYASGCATLFRVRRAFLCLVCVAALAGCGSSDPKANAPTAEQIKTAFAGSPPALATLHAQANQLLGGSKSDFEAAMKRLRGHPVVVNKWGSWCGPCRAEFPVFQQVAVKLGKRVAFLGLDGSDPDDSARKFLAKFPVTYPSYRDPEEKIGPSIQAGVAYPTTVFFDRRGKLVYAHPGPYDKEADLLTDIRRYTR
jgi:cytochrome c biogenesis protein CcmG/thiol:disulfide interchange protein DsbE